MWLWYKIINSGVWSLAGQTVKCYSGEKASVGNVNAEGAFWKRRRLNFGQKVKMEAAALFKAAGNASVCLSVCRGRMDPSFSEGILSAVQSTQWSGWIVGEKPFGLQLTFLEENYFNFSEFNCYLFSFVIRHLKGSYYALPCRKREPFCKAFLNLFYFFNSDGLKSDW